MSDPESSEIEESSADSKKPEPVTSQLGAVAVVGGVCLVLWLISQIPGRIHEYQEKKKSEQAAGIEGDANESSEEETPEAEESGEEEPLPLEAESSDDAPPIVEVVDAPEVPRDEDWAPPQSEMIQYYRRQLVKALGGSDKAEVRHLAISDDQSRMVAAIRLVEKAGDDQLVEIYFKRDEFGSYLSEDDSPIGRAIKLWSN